MPSFERMRRPKLAEIRDQAEGIRSSGSADVHTDRLATLLVDLVDAIDPDVVKYCDQRRQDRLRDLERGKK